jgi:hypothetical protein
MPSDLAENHRQKELVKAYGIKDESIAKPEMWPVVEAWNRQFDDVHSRRDITPDD